MGMSAVIGVVGYIFTVGGSGEASTAISAPTLSADQLASPTPNLLETQVIVLSTQVAELSSANATLAAANTSGQVLPTTTPTVEAAAEATADSAPANARYQIVAEESEVRFILTEDLLGNPTTVTGRTNQVAGEIFVDFGAPANSRVGMIRINARTLLTDNEFRNRALRTQILQSTNDDYEFSDFTPTEITGLPDKIEVGQEVTFQIIGDLKVRDIVQSVTFDVTATLVSDDRLEGKAATQVTREQYNLQIPNAPGVANVSNEVTLEIDFVATKVQT
jgi:polyisoprenoid-binding protein YceI